MRQSQLTERVTRVQIAKVLLCDFALQNLSALAFVDADFAFVNDVELVPNFALRHDHIIWSIAGYLHGAAQVLQLLCVPKL